MHFPLGRAPGVTALRHAGKRVLIGALLVRTIRKYGNIILDVPCLIHFRLDNTVFFCGLVRSGDLAQYGRNAADCR